ncbi:hypothetical protein [Paenibacillus sp. Leaf72]|uniref:hypothetical protein n=1 Tax=Paenibacillus sp. Leaf72 TaxID=1736234 RepID=UPI0006F2A167|nr:hypothetical protein [Paenibacillus sp. Leaf72]KQN96940.1 hypothetical protein ASF12_23000 [Paenibacillus sp. Leaf72]
MEKKLPQVLFLLTILKVLDIMIGLNLLDDSRDYTPAAILILAFIYKLFVTPTFFFIMSTITVVFLMIKLRMTNTPEREKSTTSCLAATLSSMLCYVLILTFSENLEAMIR